MTRTTLATFATLLVAAILAVQIGGRVGMGITMGVLCGSSVSLLGAAWQRHTLRTRPQRGMQAVVEIFLFKLVFVLIGALSFRFLEAAASRADWRAFLVTFVATAAIVQTVSVFENVRLLKNSSGTPSPQADPILAPSQAE